MSAPLPLDLLHLSYVKRWVVAPTHRDQSVAEHTFRVQCIALSLHYRTLGIDQAIGKLLLHVMAHDAEERFTGDVPGPNKSLEPGYLRPLHSITPLAALVKVADSIETGTFWVQWGNRAAWVGHPYNNAPGRDIEKIEWYAAKVPGLLEAAGEVWMSITGQYEVYKGAAWPKH